MIKMRKFNLLIFAFCALFFYPNSKAQLLYKVEGNGLARPSYIFGTHHLAPLDVADKSGAIQYLDSVDIIIGEIDLTQDMEAAAMQMASHMIAPEDSTLSKVLTPEEYSLVDTALQKWAAMLGIELNLFDSMKPVVVSTMLAQAIMSELLPDFDPSKQLDTFFMATGKLKGKKIRALETPEYQAVVLFDSTPVSEQAKALVALVKDPDKSIELAKSINEAYYAGDLEAMFKLSQEEDENPEFMVALLDRRNANWIEELPEMIKEDSAFIAVGALHLAGENGIINGLRERGYIVTPQ